VVTHRFHDPFGDSFLCLSWHCLTYHRRHLHLCAIGGVNGYIKVIEFTSHNCFHILNTPSPHHSVIAMSFLSSKSNLIPLLVIYSDGECILYLLTITFPSNITDTTITASHTILTKVTLSSLQTQLRSAKRHKKLFKTFISVPLSDFGLKYKRFSLLSSFFFLPSSSSPSQLIFSFSHDNSHTLQSQFITITTSNRVELYSSSLNRLTESPHSSLLSSNTTETSTIPHTNTRSSSQQNPFLQLIHCFEDAIAAYFITIDLLAVIFTQGPILLYSLTLLHPSHSPTVTLTNIHLIPPTGVGFERQMTVVYRKEELHLVVNTKAKTLFVYNLQNCFQKTKIGKFPLSFPYPSSSLSFDLSSFFTLLFLSLYSFLFHFFSYRKLFGVHHNK
jgi:hypothetical protein